MNRISSLANNLNLQNSLRTQESRLNNMNQKIGSQRKIQALRDDPITAGHLVRYQSYLNRVKTFQNNAATLSDKFSYQEGYMSNSLEVLQRVREIAVTGANGIYSPEDLKNMGGEVDTLLKELLQNANAVAEDGSSLFSGTNTHEKPFEVEYQNVDGSGIPLINQVRYNGNIDSNKIEVDEQKHIEVDNSGNKVFWAEQQTLYGLRDAKAFVVPSDSVINIDNVDIPLTAGDNVYSIISKINNSAAAVKASLDPVTNGLNLETTDARQLWLADKSGAVLNTLGIINTNAQKPPYNIAGGAKVSGGSLFDAVIALRNSLLKGDQEAVGGRVLGAIDNGLSNLIARISKSGSQYERVNNEVIRNGNTALLVTQTISREGDLDYTQAVTDLKMLDYMHQATLNQAGKLYSNTLLNYLR